MASKCKVQVIRVHEGGKVCSCLAPKYEYFPRGFRDLHNSGKTGVFFNTAENSYMVCGLINYIMRVTSFCCNYSKLVNNQARELL